MYLVSEEDAQTLAMGYKPPNTSRATKWALTNFEQWQQARNQSLPKDPVPSFLLADQDPALLDKWVRRLGSQKKCQPQQLTNYCQGY